MTWLAIGVLALTFSQWQTQIRSYKPNKSFPPLNCLLLWETLSQKTKTNCTHVHTHVYIYTNNNYSRKFTYVYYNNDNDIIIVIESKQWKDMEKAWMQIANGYRQAWKGSNSNSMKSWKRQNCGDSKMVHVCQRWVPGDVGQWISFVWCCNDCYIPSGLLIMNKLNLYP